MNGSSMAARGAVPGRPLRGLPACTSLRRRGGDGGAASHRPPFDDLPASLGMPLRLPSRSRSARLALLLAVLGGAVPVRASAQVNNCIPPTGHAEPVGSLDALRGSFLVIAYGTSGPRKGRITSGTLELAPAPAEMRREGTLMIGSSSLDLARVGGRFSGSLRSRDPGAPGVTLEAPAAGGRATLTFGSVRTRTAAGELAVPVTRFELAERSLLGYRGYWRTHGAGGPSAAGYFCATRF